ncbi:MAG: hypothetical protein ACHRHE_04760 [Tepidisphaerales bacterium]
MVAEDHAGAQRLSARLRDDRLGQDALRAAGAFNLRQLKRVFQIIGRTDWPGLLEALEVFLHSSRPLVRKLTAETLVGRGDALAADVAVRLLAGADVSTHAGVFAGIERALTENRAAVDFRQRLFDRIALDSAREYGPRVYPALCTPPKLMMKLDPHRAAQMLTSPEILRADNPALTEVLWEIDESRLDVPPALLQALIPGLSSASAIRALLPCLARCDPAASLSMGQHCLDHPDFDVRAEAFASWLRTLGVDLFSLTPKQNRSGLLAALATLHQILGILGADGLLAAMQQVPAASWPAAIQLLEHAGATRTARCLREASELASQSEEPADAVIEGLEDELLDDPDRLYRKLYEYVEPQISEVT